MYLAHATGLQRLSSFPPGHLENGSRWSGSCHRSLEKEKQQDEARPLGLVQEPTVARTTVFREFVAFNNYVVKEWSRPLLQVMYR